MDEKIKKAIMKIMESDPDIVGFSNQLRDGKIIMYVKDRKTLSRLTTSLKVGDITYPVEYVVIGQIRALDSM